MWFTRFYQTIRLPVKGFPSIRLAIGQPLAFNFLKAVHRALMIGHFAAAVVIVKLGVEEQQIWFAGHMSGPRKRGTTNGRSLLRTSHAIAPEPGNDGNRTVIHKCRGFRGLRRFFTLFTLFSPVFQLQVPWFPRVAQKQG